MLKPIESADLTDLLSQLDWLNDQQPAMVELVERLCNQNSGTHNLAGIEAVAQILVEAYQPLLAQLERLPADDVESLADDGSLIHQRLGDCLLFSKYPHADRQVLLCIHRDTVYGQDNSFQSCRWINDKTLNGPGVADAKGGLVVMLYALMMLERSPLAGKIGWKVLINADEEIGSPGSSRLINQLAPQCQFGMLFEPALPDGTLISWRKGVGNFAFQVRGRSAHAGRDFAAGRNAIVSLSHLMTQISQLNTDPEVTYNIGRISGGGALNVVPDLAIGRVNVRVKTTAQQQIVLGHFQRLMDELNRQEGLSVSLHGDFTSPPKMLDASVQSLQNRIETCASVLGQSIRWQGSGGGSDGNKFADAGLPNIDSLGPIGGSIHSSDEFLDVTSLVSKAKLAALVLLSYAALDPF